LAVRGKEDALEAMAKLPLAFFVQIKKGEEPGAVL